MLFLGVHMPAQISAFQLEMMSRRRTIKQSLLNALSLDAQSKLVKDWYSVMRILIRPTGSMMCMSIFDVESSRELVLLSFSRDKLAATAVQLELQLPSERLLPSRQCLIALIGRKIPVVKPFFRRSLFA